MDCSAFRSLWQRQVLKKIVFFFAASAFISKIAGILREVISAYVLGTGEVADAVRFSFNYAVFIVHIFTLDAFFNSLVPHLKTSGDASILRKFFYILNSLFFLIVLMSAVFSNGILSFSKIFVLERNVIFFSFLPFIFIYFFYICVSGFELSKGMYVLSSLRPLLQNAGFIAGLILYHYFSSTELIGITVNLVYSMFVFFYSVHIGAFSILAGRIFPLKIERNVLKTYNDFFIFQLFWNITLLAENIAAGNMGKGEIAGLNYTKTLIETLPVLISIPISNAMLASFSSFETDKKRLYIAIRFCIFLGLVTSIFFLISGRYILKLLFFRGAFGEDSIEICLRYLISYTPGLFAYLNFYILQRFLGIYSMSHIHLRVGVVSQVINIAGVIFLPYFIGSYGIGLSFSISQILYFFAILYRIKKL